MDGEGEKAAHPSRASRGATGHRASPLSSPAPSPPPSPPLSLSPCAAERSGGGSAEKRDRSCGAGWGCAARRGRSDHGCSHRGWFGILRGCSRRGQAAAVAIAEVCACHHCFRVIPSHAIPARKRACHSVRVSVGSRAFPLLVWSERQRAGQRLRVDDCYGWGMAHCIGASHDRTAPLVGNPRAACFG